MSEHKLLEELKKDHAEQKRLGKKLIEARSRKDREQLRQQFYASLYPHIVGEEASIFPFLVKQGKVEVRDDALEALEEHHVAKIVLDEVMNFDAEHDAFKAKVKVLDELNRHHIEEEEEEIFAHLREMCDTGGLDELYEQYEQAEKKAKP